MPTSTPPSDRDEGHVLIAGDQILQRITPVIGAFGHELESDPLSDYLGSLPRFEVLPEDTLVLPSHGLPFHGLHARLAQLRAHHRERLAELLSHMREPRSALALADLIFERAMQEGQGRFALARNARPSAPRRNARARAPDRRPRRWREIRPDAKSTIRKTEDFCDKIMRQKNELRTRR